MEEEKSIKTSEFDKKFSAYPHGITVPKAFNKKHRKKPSIAKITYPKLPNRTSAVPKPSIPNNAMTQSLSDEILAIKLQLKPITMVTETSEIRKEKPNEFFDPVAELKRLTPVEKATQEAIDDTRHTGFLKELNQAQEVLSGESMVQTLLECTMCDHRKETELHCFAPLKVDGQSLQCESCGHSESITQHCNKSMIEASSDNLAIHQYQIGIMYHERGEYEKSIDYLKQSLQVYEKISGSNMVGWTKFHLGRSYFNLGSLDDSLTQLDAARKLFEDEENQLGIAWTLNGLGDLKLLQGDLIAAQFHFIKSEGIFDKIGDEEARAWSLLTLSKLYAIRGELEKALNYSKSAILIFEELHVPFGRADTLDILGKIMVQLEDYTQAINYYEESHEIFEKLKNVRKQILIEFHLILCFLDQQRIELAEEKLEVLKYRNLENSNPELSMMVEIGEALLLKSKPRMIHKAEALKILGTVVNRDIINNELYILSMLHYTDLLILELKKFENPDVLRELLILTDKMTELAKDQKNVLLEVQTSVIKANLYLLDGDLEMSTALLEDLYEQTIALQLSNLANRVKSLQEEISQNMTNWNELITKNASLKDRIEQSNLDEYIRIALSTRNSSINVGE